MVQIYQWLHSRFKDLSNDTSQPKSELKRRSYDFDKLDKENYRNKESSVATKFSVATEKLCYNRENSVATNFFVATEQTLLQ